MGRRKGSDFYKKKKQALLKKKIGNFQYYKRIASDKLKVAIVEITISIYHTISHHRSYSSMDCGIELNSSLYGHSIIAKKKKTLWAY